MADESTDSGVFETRKDAGLEPNNQVKMWMQAIELASKDEKDWRQKADEAVDRFRDETERGNAQFNILHSQIETLGPAVYNSTPIPDVRQRFGDSAPVPKTTADVLERTLTTTIDMTDFDDVMNAVIHDTHLVGRGQGRVRYRPTFDAGETTVIDQRTAPEYVPWKDYLEGPGNQWVNVMWVAFQHRLTREDLIAMNPKDGPKVRLDWAQTGTDDGDHDSDIFKRAVVWEIWDKEKREVLFIAKSFDEKPLLIVQDPLKLIDFYPVPRPILDIQDTNSMVPLVPYEMYKDQAQELDILTARITNLVKVLKWRGIRPAQIAELDNLAEANDGDLIASASFDAMIMGGANPDNAIWLMPIERLITVIRELVLQRETVKQIIFEITGLSDIMRGSTDPNETLGAQQLKTQFGSLRLQRRQREAQRFARDLIRMQAEIIADKFTVDTLRRMSGIELQDQPQPPDLMAMLNGEEVEQEATWPQVMELLRSDVMRTYRVDVEIDSTIQADVARIQSNMANFVNGLGTFLGAVGPAVQQGAMPLDVATELMIAFSRSFRLGRSAEDALERMGEQEPQQQPDPAQQAAQAEQQEQLATLQAEQAKTQSEEQRFQVTTQAKAQENQQKMVAEGAKFQLDKASREQDVQLKKSAQNLEAAKVLDKRKEDEFNRRVKDREMLREDTVEAGENEVNDTAVQAMQAMVETALATAQVAEAQATMLAQAITELGSIVADMSGSEALVQATEGLTRAAEAMAAAALAPRQAVITKDEDGNKVATSSVVLN